MSVKKKGSDIAPFGGAFTPSSDASRSLAESFSRAMDGESLVCSGRMPRYGERLFGYEDCVYDAARVVLRGYCDRVYGWSGKCWEPLDDIVLEQSLRYSLAGAGVMKDDLSKCIVRLVRKAKDGAMMSPLRPRRSLVGFENGIWDFADMGNPVYHDFGERLDVLEVLPYAYDTRMGCPEWERFLDTVLTRPQVSLLQKYLSLGMVDRGGMGHKVEETLWLVGSGANGKSVIFDVVSGVYGRGSVSSVGLLSLIRGGGDERARFIAAIEGKAFNYCTEVQAGDMSRYGDAFKALCSGEPQAVRRLGGDVRMAYDIPYLVFNMNRKPPNRLLDFSILRRLLFITFRTTVSGNDLRGDLSSVLAGEYGGIRNWLIEGWRKFVAGGYRLSATSESDGATDEYLVENGETGLLYLRKMGYRSNRYSGHWEERPRQVPADALYNDYVAWCERWLYEPETQQSFGRMMTRHGYQRKASRYGNVYEVFSDNGIPFAAR